MIFYNLIIHPIRQLLEICYIFFDELFGVPGISVMALSFAVTICCLPLYIVAEHWQEVERQKQKEMAPYIALIKRAFKGDERYMMTSTYYRLCHYAPIMALRSSFGLFIQIPFFTAAYSFLSNLPALQGSSFLFIKNMGAPDALFSIGSFSVNILPITMTAINCVSGAIYSHGHGSIREKVQIYGMALIFLVLLYDSPAGLVVYWTMNNLLSLVKNVFYKLKNPIRTLYFIAAGAGIFGSFFVLFALKETKIELKAMFIMLCILIIVSPLIVRFFIYFIDNFLSDITENKKSRTLVFVASALTLAVLVGLAVPSMLIESEPQEFCFVDTYTSPFVFLNTVLFQSLGMYVFWPLCFYALFGLRIKKLLTLLFAFMATYAIVNTFIFTGSYGPMTKELDFMEAQFFRTSLPSILLNLVLALAVFVLAVLFLHKKSAWLTPYYFVLILSLGGISGKNLTAVNMAYKNMTPPVSKSSIEPVYHLSKTGKNVLVFMQDRLFSPLIDEVFEEKEGLAARFEGFTFYPNTVSMGQLTMLGTPGLFGGYSYTPAEMNRRDTETLQQKQNEAILSMPITFHEAGFTATVSDMPYENFGQEPVTDMYRDTPWINRVTTMGVYSDYWYEQHGMEKPTYISDCLKHNFLMFGIFKSFPPYLRRLVHHKRWWNTKGRKDYFYQFIDHYSCLEYFPELFDSDETQNTFTMIDNRSTHEPFILQQPEYVPVKEVTQFGEGKWAHNAQYNSQVATLLRYADFFDWMRANGVYDNTRIIIVSDHGAEVDTGKFDNSNMLYSVESVTAALLVKDFGDKAKSPDGIHMKKDMTFMTNADTPALATKGLIENAANPFQKTPYDVTLWDGEKSDYVKICHPLSESTRNRAHTKLSIPNDIWYTVKDDIFKAENWQRIYPFGE